VSANENGARCGEGNGKREKKEKEDEERMMKSVTRERMRRETEKVLDTSLFRSLSICLLCLTSLSFSYSLDLHPRGSAYPPGPEARESAARSRGNDQSGGLWSHSDSARSSQSAQGRTERSKEERRERREKREKRERLRDRDRGREKRLELKRKRDREIGGESARDRRSFY
jgi:hypothetical protein